MILVKKKDNSWRLCVDYKTLNIITLNILIIKEKLLIPLIDELLKELAGSIVFSKVNLRFKYYHIRMTLKDIFNTTFKTHNACYKFLLMPFNLTNAPIIF